MPRRSATGADAIKTAERMAQVWEMRKTGASYTRIAKALGADRSTLRRQVRRHLDKLHAENMESANDVRALDLARLDDANTAIWAQVRQGNHGAIDRLIRIMERRARLLGLDAATKSEITGADGGPLEVNIHTMTDEALEARIRELTQQG